MNIKSYRNGRLRGWLARLDARHLSLRTRAKVSLLCITLAAAIWAHALPAIIGSSVADPSAPGVSPAARALAERHLDLWSRQVGADDEIGQLRRSNAEWDFMGRTFLVLALANLGLREPPRRDEYLTVIDQIIEDTLAQERRRGMFYFLMDYARDAPFKVQPGRSLFIDGELALMMAARQLVEPRASYRPRLLERVEQISARMRRSPVLCAESYPDECWLFCHAVALAAIKITDLLEGTDHSDLLDGWIEVARAHLTDPGTGLLVSSYSFAGEVKDGPEGSSIFLAAHCLQIIDEPLAADQYRRARRELGRDLLGLGYAREWPASWVGGTDVDSGPIIPLLRASPGASGLALVGAAAFRDHAYYRQLHATLRFAAFPIEQEGRLRYGASNQVGDAVILYAAVQGPLWREVRRLERSSPVAHLHHLGSTTGHSGPRGGRHGQ